MARWTIPLVVFIGCIAAIYQSYVRPFITIFGVFREVEEIGNKASCETVPELEACEKMILHEPSGIVYLACSTPKSRIHWFATIRGEDSPLAPSRDREFVDYLAMYDTATGKVTRLQTPGFNTSQTLGLHGMDVVPSSKDPNLLYLFLVNHLVTQDPDIFTETVIDIFQTRAGKPSLTHLRTVKDPVIFDPNDIVGSSDGKSFYFTNFLSLTPGPGILKAAKILLGLPFPSSSIGYCHIDKGCKIVAKNLPSSNGIARAANDTFYIASTFHGGLTVLERREDDQLQVVDILPTEYGMDNLSIDPDDVVWAPAFPNHVKLNKHLADPKELSPTAVVKFSKSLAAESKHSIQMEKVFEDNGDLVTGATTVVHDPKRRLLLMHGVMSPWLTVCKI